MRVHEERFTFGKYADVPLPEIPDSYLRWAVENLENPDYDLINAIEAEQARRKDNQRKMEALDRIARQTPEGRAALVRNALDGFMNDEAAQARLRFRPRR